MLLGKRPRPPMRRTTSMTEFAPDLESPEGPRTSDQERAQQHQRERQRVVVAAEERPGSRYVAAVATQRGGARSSGDFSGMEMAAFLKTCGLCKRRLSPGRDIFMYRGEIAFCSLECRQQQMNLDERKEKWSQTSMKDASPAAATGSEASSSGETVAAA